MLRKSVLVVFCALLLGPALSALAGFDPTLAVYWPLDEGTGRVVHDATGNGINGTISAGPTWVTSGEIGGALNFTVAGDVRGAHVAIDRRSFTIAMWVNPLLAGDQTLFSEVQSASTSLSLYLRIGGPSATAGQVPTNGIRFGFYDDDVDSPANILQSNNWYHLTFRYDSTSKNQSIYVNGVQVATRTTSDDFLATTGVICLGSGTGSSYFTGMVDDFQLYQKALSDAEIKNVMEGLSRRFLAKVVSPAEAAVDVPRDVVLSWKPGPYAVTHNVFLGTTFDDVNTATVANSTGQSETTFDPPGLLDFGQTYYWRVDEVNAPPDSTIYKGSVWSFTTEPYTYTIPSATATASSESTAQGMTAVKTVDGSGLYASGQHSSVGVDGWLSAPTAKLPAWIRYDFDRAYMIRQMKVWNSNQKIEPFAGFGAKSVLIEYSLDGVTWTALKTEEFPQADGTDTYAGFLVDMSDVLAKFVRLTIQSNWGGYYSQSGLSEVRFLYVPVQAREPSPAMYAEGVPVDSVLGWREGRQAVSNKVYFSKDKAAVADDTALADTTTEHIFQPAAMEFGQSYFWKVDEVNDAASTPVWTGDLWTFTTTEWGDIDNFESYTNESPNRVFQTWIDGWGFSKDDFFPTGNPGNGTGSMVGYDPMYGPIMETVVVHSGVQSMPVEYNNVNQPYYSEIERVFDTTQDWTANGATDLGLWFRGRPVAFIETASGVTLSGGGADIYNGTDQFRFAYKKLTGDGSITVRVDNVQTLANWTKSGVMIRESLDPLAIQVHMITAAAQSLVEWMYRNATGSTTTTGFNTAANSNPLPVWLRITRAGNVFTGECSADGKTWTKITQADGTASSATLTMPASVYIGMVVCSNWADNLAVANFSQIKTTGNVTGQWQTADVGVAQPANSPDQLYVVIQDSVNKTVVVKHPDGVNAVLANQWTQWKIPFSQLAGVNVKAVKKMIIGVGDRSSPKAGGAGKLYIDDIQYGRPIVPVGLVAYYKLENNTLDSSGNGHDGTAVGSPIYMNGPAGKCMAIQVNGVGGQYVELGTFNPSEKTGMLSVSLWANWKGPTGQYQGLMAKRNW